MRLDRAGRRGLCASFVVIAAGLSAVGAVAYACTGGGQSQTFVSPNFGTHNQPLTVKTYTSGGGLTPNTINFFFRYTAPGDSTPCHAAATIGGAVTSTSSGGIGSVSSKYTRKIPNLGSTGGTGLACWAVGPANNALIAMSAKITVN